MSRKLIEGLALLLLAATAQPACAPSTRRSFAPGAAASSPDVVHVAPPTGEQQADRASILSALEQVRPGGTVQFAAGTYLIGGLNLDVAVPHVTLLGHPDGTTIRGCEPEAFADRETAMFGCNALGLSGAGQNVRNLTFEYAWHGLAIGCCLPASLDEVEAWGGPEQDLAGGHIIEDNTFRYTPNGLRVMGKASEPVVIRRNTFIDVYHAIVINGGRVHFLDNDLSVHEPTRVPSSTHPGDVIAMTPAGGPGDHTTCSDNLVARNRIAGYPDGIRILLFERDTSCRHNTIRDNVIQGGRVPFASPWAGIRLADESDRTVVGVPIALLNLPLAYPDRYGPADPAGAGGSIGDNLVEGNRVIGAEGLGIEVLHASRNRIVGNTITAVRQRPSFPGNTLTVLPLWSEGNGSGIWISPGSEETEIVGNTFENIATHAVVLEGDLNRVELRSASDAIHDLGSGNVVVGSPAPPAAHEEVEALTARFVRALNDESWRLLAPFYAPDAVLALPGGSVLEGREAILAYFRPIVARIRGVEVTSSRAEEDERGVTVTTTYTARFAPVTDPAPGTFSNTWARQPDGSWLIVAGTFELPGDPQVDRHGSIRSGYFHSDGVRLHYLDFGGEGVPVLFISSGDRSAYAFMEFAPRFTDRNRVLALSQRGAGPSEGDPAPVAARDLLGRDIIALLDALGIERAVVAHMWENVLVYLAEQHPERVAGLVFLEGLPPRGVRTEDPLGIFAMLARNLAAMWGADPDASRSWAYEPRFLSSGEAVDVPSLLFVDENRTEESEWEQLIEFAALAGRIRVLFPDPVARTYFERLAVDEEMQEQGRSFWREVVVPAQRVEEEAFHRAFGGSLRTAAVEGRALGYGYRDAPDLIEPHIRAFLEEVGALERRRSAASPRR